MKEQIRKILEMAKAGTVSDAQAAELIEALGARSATESARPVQIPPMRPPHFGERVGLFERVIDAVSGGRTSSVSGVLPSHMNGNDFSMSEVAVIGGTDFVFRDNHVRMSHLKDLTLTRTEMIGNDIGSSKVRDVTCRDSAITGCTIHASSFEDVALEDSQMTQLQMRASKFSDARLQKSRIEELAITASQVKDLALSEGSLWERSRIEATHLMHWATKSSTIADVGFDMSRLSNVAVTRSVLRISMVRGYRWSDVKVLDCVFEDVMFGGGEANRKCLVKDATFENCKFDKAIFADTMIVATTIRNVTLTGVKVMDVVLKDRVIDGNAQFLEAIGGEAALVKHAPEA
jgi:uncharacterized protein YjbI with pentapeptide repeats